jgi:protease-4
MSFETDLLLDRRRLKRRLSYWRGATVVAVLLCLLIAVWRGGGAAVPHAHVARLTVTGIIAENSKLTAAITRLAGDDNVKALLVEINSPGGAVAGGESLHDAIALVAAKKPVVSVMGGIAASAGYMIAVPAARIFARNATLTGSIGVILETGEISGLLGKLGITADAIVSGPLKDQPSFTKPLSPAGREVLQALVMDLYDQFVAMVASGRHMSADKVRSLADGRAYTGRQALDLGLVDAIGGEPDARAWLAAERGVPASLPARDVTSKTWAERALGNALGGVSQDLLKSVLFQGVRLDGAWAVWQPSVAGE